MEMSERTVNVNYGFGPMFLLTLLLVALKITGHLDWSWLWVLAPMWLPPAILIGGFVVVIGIAIIAAIIISVFDL